VFLARRASGQQQRKQHNVDESKTDGTAYQSSLLLCSGTKKLSGCRREVNVRSEHKLLSRAGNLYRQFPQSAPCATNYFRGPQLIRSEERRVGKECRSWWARYH